MPTAQPTTYLHTGRGGAGNWATSKEEKERQLREEMAAERELKEKVEKEVKSQVDIGLPPPPAAYRRAE
jgi:hypothetical protein